MRTTVTLEPDIAAKLKLVARERGVSFKSALNSALRAGLDGASMQKAPYRMPSRSMGVRPGLQLDQALQLAGDLEETEILRKIDLRK